MSFYGSANYRMTVLAFVSVVMHMPGVSTTIAYLVGQVSGMITWTRVRGPRPP